MLDLRNGNNGAAPAAPEPHDTTLPLSDLSVRNIHTGILIRSFRPLANAAALREMADCEDLFKDVLASNAGGRFLFGFEPRDLLDRDAHLVSVRDGQRVIGTMHFHRDAPARVTFRGAVVHPAYKGQRLGSAMGAIGLLHDLVANGDVEEVHCAVRVLADNQPNHASKVSFSRLGFMLETDCGTTYLKGSFRDRHLFSSAEIDADGNSYIRYRRMRAGPETLPRARAFLAAWSRAILPFPLDDAF